MRIALFSGLLLFRLLNVCFIQTAFVPDEFWQSIEVAHNWAFGYGAITWEWDPEVALRSPIHPLLFTFLYRCLSWFSLDSKLTILLVPRIFHALLAAMTDLHLYKLVSKLSGPTIATWTLIHQGLNWFTFFCASRTLSNNLEWCLTMIALNYYPWKSLGRSAISPSGHLVYICFAVICVLTRPTACVTWFPLCLLHLSWNWWVAWTENKRYSNRKAFKENTTLKLFGRYVLISCVLLVFSLLLDRWAFDRWTMNQWNFLRFNLFSGGAHFYGVHPWHWYLSQGLPVILLTQLPFFLLGLCSVLLPGSRFHKQSNNQEGFALRVLCGAFVWTVFCYSLLSHKEFRFVFPLAPIMFYFCAIGTQWILSLRLASRHWSSWVILFVVCTQAPIALYTTMVHQRGTLDAMSAVHRTIEKLRFTSHSNAHLLVLMPCHSVPSVGFLHMNITIRQLSCDPDLAFMTHNREKFDDEADRFYTNPIRWLRENYPGKGPSGKPHFILAFDHLYQSHSDVVDLVRKDWRFTSCGRYFHTHFPTHSRHGNYVNVWCHPSIRL